MLISCSTQQLIESRAPVNFPANRRQQQQPSTVSLMPSAWPGPCLGPAWQLYGPCGGIGRVLVHSCPEGIKGGAYPVEWQFFGRRGKPLVPRDPLL
ncbi:MAG: hypothetical protein DCF24_02790 [Cyanobium sp.]|nr:MAG: hypothetical protein DCF24_02790 [Cyanobium sp.]